jgi:DNA-binding winged helix-turn-helix (wHTH) protein/tetratricopeptide (TPR) repeat protein/TolB-like protein
MLTSPSHKLRFDQFTLDTARCVLLRGEIELSLRRQSFEVLRYLAEHAGKVVSSDELIEALWPTKPADHTASVGQCIKEIRRAIGDDARWVIKTVSGRGYEFMADVMPFPTSMPSEVVFSTSVIPAAKPGKLTTEGEGEPRASLASERPFWRANRLLTVPLSSVLAGVLVAGVWMLWPWREAAPRESVLTMMAEPTIAVLPFTTHGTPNGSGFEAEVRSELARVHRGFDLIIRPATNDREPLSSPTAAGARRGARYVVVGTTWLDRAVERANIQLVEAETERQIWSESFEFNREQKGATNRMPAQIARMLIIQVRTAESRRPLPVTAEAGHYVLQGRALHETERSPQSTREAQSLFKKALLLDPSSVSALQGFATTRVVQVHNAWIPWNERPSALIEAEEAIERLVKLDPGNAVGHYLRASLLRALGLPDKAIASLHYALSLNPNYFAAHAELGRIKIDAGRAHESIAHIREALELNPPEANMHVLYFWMGFAALHIADDEAAAQWLLKARQTNPAFPLSPLYLAPAYLGIGDEEQARATMAEYLKGAPKFSIAEWKRWVPTPNPIVARQRERIMNAWRRLGVAEGEADQASRRSIE